MRVFHLCFALELDGDDPSLEFCADEEGAASEGVDGDDEDLSDASSVDAKWALYIFLYTF